MGWASESFTQVRTTKESIALEPSECVSISDARLKPGDDVQLRRGRAQAQLARDTLRTDDPGDFAFLSFENSRSFLAYLAFQPRSTGSSTVINVSIGFYDIENDTLGSPRNLGSSVEDNRYGTGDDLFGKAKFTPRGNEYILGTAHGNWIITEPADASSEPGFREMGYDPAPDIYTIRDVPDILNTWYDDVQGSELQALAEDVRERVNQESVRALGEFDYKGASFWDWSGYTKQTNFGILPMRVFVYWYTEYDSVNDIESQASTAVRVLALDPTAMVYVHPGRNYIEVKDNFHVEFDIQNISKKNASADKIRVYRTFLGHAARIVVYGKDGAPAHTVFTESNKATERADAMVAGTRGLVGGQIQEVDYDITNPFGVTTISDYHYRDGYLDTPISYPLVSAIKNGVVSLDPFLVKPTPWTFGMMLGDALITVPADEQQTTYYAFPGSPEYQPRTAYRESILSERSDKILGGAQVRMKPVFLTASGCIRYNYLPYEGETFRDEQQKFLSGQIGVTGRKAWDKFTLPDGEWLVWLNAQGIYATNGNQVRDLCPAWRPEDAFDETYDLSRAVLINDPRDNRLMLYVPHPTDNTTVRWDFYYHSTLLRKDGLRPLGPSLVESQVVGAARGSANGQDRVYLWTMDRELPNGAFRKMAVWLEGEGWTVSSNITMRRWKLADPLKKAQIKFWAMDHTATDGLKFSLTPVTWNVGSGPMTNGVRTINVNTGYGIRWSKDFAQGIVGNEHQMSLLIECPEDSGDWAVGPLHLQMEDQSGGLL